MTLSSWVLSSWVGRVIVVAATLIGVNLARHNESSAELSRFVPIEVTDTKPVTVRAFAGRPGSIDQIVDTSEGLVVEGWISEEVDNIHLVVAPAELPTGQKVLLFARLDVMLAGGPRLSGFRVVFAQLKKSSVACITFDGPLGTEVLWSRGTSCG